LHYISLTALLASEPERRRKPGQSANRHQPLPPDTRRPGTKGHHWWLTAIVRGAWRCGGFDCRFRAGAEQLGGV